MLEIEKKAHQYPILKQSLFLTPMLSFQDANIFNRIIFIPLLILQSILTIIKSHLEYCNDKVIILNHIRLIYIVRLYSLILLIIIYKEFISFIFYWFYLNILFYRYIHIIRKCIFYVFLPYAISFEYSYYIFINHGYSR